MKLFVAVASVAVLAGCQSFSNQPTKEARANLEAKSGSSVMGYADFVQRGDKVLVTVKVSGLKPNSEHGFHVHEKGDCSAVDATSAGGHFNPDTHPHNHPKEAKRHAGAMVNLKADGNGVAQQSFEVDTIRVDDSKYGILNRALIVHANPDDYASQPVGNAGGRIACGIIKKV